jgi:ubiquitin C-terminal hydrolase
MDRGSAPHEPCGLLNLGNTCYLNAALQLLAHCRLMLHYMLVSVPGRTQANGSGSGSGDGSLAAELRELFVGMWTSRQPCTPRGLVRLLPQITTLRVHDQNDAHELLTALVHRLTTELAGPAPSHPRVRTSADAWMSTLAADGIDGAHPFVGMFHGQTVSWVDCPACGARSSGHDVFTSIHLALPPARRQSSATLESLVNGYFEATRVSGWRCGSCGITTNALRATELVRAPGIMIFCIKRFEVDGAVNRLPVVLPHELCITRGRHVHEYKLSSVVLHSGTQHAGHYTALVRGLNRTFFAVDDGRVRPQPLDAIPLDMCYVVAYEQ